MELAEPVFLNPSSHESIVEVLWFIGKQAGIKHYGGNEREWVTIVCDGLPYGLVRSAIDGSKEFGWVHLLPGLLHEEMNMTKSFVELSWNITYSTFGKQIGYNSERLSILQILVQLEVYRDAVGLEC